MQGRQIRCKSRLQHARPLKRPKKELHNTMALFRWCPWIDRNPINNIVPLVLGSRQDVKSRQLYNTKNKLPIPTLQGSNKTGCVPSQTTIDATSPAPAKFGFSGMAANETVGSDRRDGYSVEKWTAFCAFTGFCLFHIVSTKWLCPVL